MGQFPQNSHRVAFLGGGDSLQSQAEVFSVFRERIMNMRTRIRNPLNMRARDTAAH
jgi:hypothetical protein